MGFQLSQKYSNRLTSLLTLHTPRDSLLAFQHTTIEDTYALGTFVGFRLETRRTASLGTAFLLITMGEHRIYLCL
jgi:hypothetical protein